MVLAKTSHEVSCHRKLLHASTSFRGGFRTDLREHVKVFSNFLLCPFRSSSHNNMPHHCPKTVVVTPIKLGSQLCPAANHMLAGMNGAISRRIMDGLALAHSPQHHRRQYSKSKLNPSDNAVAPKDRDEQIAFDIECITGVNQSAPLLLDALHGSRHCLGQLAC